jgi:hypothetical protein
VVHYAGVVGVYWNPNFNHSPLSLLWVPTLA